MRAWLVPLGLLAGCGADVEPLALEPGCQPLLAGADCLLPFPSDFFLAEDASTPTGRAVRIDGPAKLIVPETRVSADPTDLGPFDGFSALTPIVALLGSPVGAEGLAGVRAPPGETTRAASRTLILDAQTGSFVPHFVDLDARATDPARTGIVLRPLGPLAHERRYVVALRGLVTPEGAPAKAPEGFRRLRERVEDPSLDAARFEREVFAPLEAAGVPRAELQLAWSFTTGSEALPTRDMLEVRRLTMEWLSTHTPTVSIVSVSEHEQTRTWRNIEGKLEVPLFVDSTDPGARLVRDPSGRVVQRGTAMVPFTALVPSSVETSSAPAPLVGFGHGFFGFRSELTEPQTREIADRIGAVMIALDWQGMSRGDLFLVVEGLVTRPYDAFSFVERTHQAMASWIVAMAAARGPLRALPAFQRPSGDCVYDEGPLSFLGISEGHILGGVLGAIHPELERVALQVGGAGFSLMMSRARPFAPFLGFLEQSVPDHLDQLKFTALAQGPLDRIDPAIYAPFALSRPLAGAKTRRVMLQIGLGDTQVPNLGAFLHARALGVPLLTPSPTPVAGLEERPGPIEGSALALYDFGIDPGIYDRAIAPDLENSVHGALRTTDPALRQLDAFVRRGVIVSPCDGPCRIR